MKSVDMKDALINPNILYIIGNGFDMHHNLHTGTSDYYKLLSGKRIYDSFDNAYDLFESYGINWGEYEKSFSELDLDEIEEQIVTFPDYLSDHESDREDTIWNVNEHLRSLRQAIFGSLSEMVETANKDIDKSNKRIYNVFENAAAIISFNYTSTVEKLYDPKNIPILHIHGYYASGEELLFGYKDGDNSNKYRDRNFDPSDDGRDYYIDTQRESIASFYDGLKKEIQIKRLEDFLNSISNKIDQICVMGHSMSDVDGDYMEMIDHITNPIKWFISQFDGKPSIDDLKIYSFSNKIVFYSLNDLLI